ncbi:MAG: hypothetical protein Q9224_003872 [Gallowayella concinna]
MANFTEPPVSDLATLPRLPDILFDGWRLRPDDIARARSREELKGWNVSTLCSAYLRYQLDRHQLNAPLSAPSLISASVNSILKALSTSNDLQEDIKNLAEHCDHTMLRHILKDPRTPYVILRMLDALPQTDIHGSSGIRKLVDVDEAVLVSEQYVQTQKPELSNSYLLNLDDLANILGFPNTNGVTTFERKTPPKGGFEFLDQKRNQTMQILGTDARWKKTFDRATNGCLDGLDWNNVFIAGGVVLNTLLYTDTWEDDVVEPARKDIMECDIDLYLYGLTPDEANQKVEHIYDIWSQNTNRDRNSPQDRIMVKNSKTITFLPRYPVRRIQIILKILPTPQDILLNFDLDACAIGFDGTRILMLPRCARAIETGYCVFTMDLIWGHHLSRRRETQEIRVFKYADRGFGMRLLPSYVRSLELCTPEDVDKETEEYRGGPTRVYKGEPGLKTLKRLAHIAQDFLHRHISQHDQPLLISLAGLDGFRMHDDLPDHRSGLGVFELLMRHVEAWRLDVVGLAELDRRSFPSLTYEETYVYDGLPAYTWASYSRAGLDQFESGAEEHDNRLFRILKRIIAEKLNIDPGNGRYMNYLTRRIRRMIVARDFQGVFAKQITMPLIIPMDLELMIVNELVSRKGSVPTECLPVFIPVHDSRSYDPRTTTMPSLTDSLSESGNLRYWLITNKNMWAGQDRVADEVSELLASLFDWYLHCEDPVVGPIQYGTDGDRCIWHLARILRRRLILPETLDKPSNDPMLLRQRNRGNRGQTLPPREARLFRSWALTRPRRVQRSYEYDAEKVDLVEAEMELDADIDDNVFWRDGDAGTWDEEEGVPVWT